MNRYSYCYNNPLIYADPTGHVPWGTGLHNASGEKVGRDGSPIESRGTVYHTDANGYLRRGPDPARQAARSVENSYDTFENEAAELDTISWQASSETIVGDFFGGAFSYVRGNYRTLRYTARYLGLMGKSEQESAFIEAEIFDSIRRQIVKHPRISGKIFLKAGKYYIKNNKARVAGRVTTGYTQCRFFMPRFCIRKRICVVSHDAFLEIFCLA